MLARVFDPFTQVSRLLDRTHSGLGVGLTLAKRLIELHGGRTAAHSEGAGHGSEFVIRLPLLDGPTVLGSGASVDAGASGMATSRRVLVVDDNDDAATDLALMVRPARPRGAHGRRWHRGAPDGRRVPLRRGVPRYRHADDDRL